VHPLYAPIIPLFDVLLHDGVHESLGMCRLAPMNRASCQRVAVFDIEATQVTHIPICVFLYYV
jgi:hypothetical protein